MQRVRMSLPYFKQFGWDAEVAMVEAKYSAISKDDLLMQTIPAGIKIHNIKALDKTWTSKLGFGHIALRSYWFYRKQVSQLLKQTKFDLIYFSTTQFPVCTLGAYWKKRFRIPYVIDMQDPWHSNYYKDKPAEQQPPKYWFSYRLNKYLEPIAMKQVDGLISVSENYIQDLKARYAEIKNIPEATITFGVFQPDMQIAEVNKQLFETLLDKNFTNIVYIGRGGADMHRSIVTLFRAINDGLYNEPDLFKKLKIYFIGTSYAPKGQGVPTILPIAEKFGLENQIVEITERISYYHTLLTLQQADALFIPGSDDPRYTASKIYPYLITKKPLLAIFNSKSPALGVFKEFDAKYAYSYNGTPEIGLKISSFLKQVINGDIAVQEYNTETIEKYSAENMTKRQCELFEEVLHKNK